MLKANIKIKETGREYQLQHPGARSYFKAEKGLTTITSEGFIQFDKEKLFDYCFGKDAGSERIIFDSDGSFVDWAKAGAEPVGNVPSMIQLDQIWFLLLQSFLRGSLSQDEDSEWEILNNPGSDSENTEVVNQ
jgi:hypothetical protein